VIAEPSCFEGMRAVQRTVAVKVSESSPIDLTIGMSVDMSLFNESSINFLMKPWICQDYAIGAMS
jgi:hypothetical protein